VIFSGLLIFY